MYSYVVKFDESTFSPRVFRTVSEPVPVNLSTVPTIQRPVLSLAGVASLNKESLAVSFDTAEILTFTAQPTSEEESLTDLQSVNSHVERSKEAVDVTSVSVTLAPLPVL